MISLLFFSFQIEVIEHNPDELKVVCFEELTSIARVKNP
jgi:hypothetical protein